MSKPIKANGVKGCLIGNYFRVYRNGGSGEFTDYRLAHSDLQVIIDDEDAYFYDEVLDHSPATLGIGENDEN